MRGLGAQGLWGKPGLIGPSSGLTAELIGAASLRAVRADTPKTTGKWYCEASLLAGAFSIVGVGNSSMNLESFVGGSLNSAGYESRSSSGGGAYASGYVNNGVPLTNLVAPNGKWMWALDADAHKFWIGIDGAWLTGNPAAGVSPGWTLTAEPVYAALSLSTGCRVRMNFGATAFTYGPPSGFLSYGAGVMLNGSDKSAFIALN